MKIRLERIILTLLLTVVLTSAQAGNAGAQQLDGLRDINVLNFNVSGAMGAGIVTMDATVHRPWSWDVGLGLWYAKGLLKVTGSSSTYGAVEHQFAGSLLFRMALPGPGFLPGKRLELGGAVPVAFWQGDSGSMDGANDLKGWAWGDPSLYLKAVVFTDGGFSIGVKPYLQMGLGRSGANASSGWSGGGTLIFGLSPNSRLDLLFEGGFIYRNATEVANMSVGKSVTWSAGARYGLTPVLDLVGDVWGETFLEGKLDAHEIPVEADLGLRISKVMDHDVLRFLTGLGTGAGTHGAGNPDVRVFAVLQWSHLAPKPLPPDTDGDGILDKDDKCPKQPEDMDGFEDEDGCPDADNDGDGILDKADKCPNKAEDKDGFEDEDGCPDADNDGDGILDKADKCPNKAEDKDGFEDEDGCPDADNDGDGIPDAKDKCPNEPETINGNKDEDGCPDKGRSLVRLTEKKIEILQKIYFYFNKAKIKRQSYPVLVQVATILRLHKEIRKVEIQGHTDTMGKADYNMKLSQKRAEAVRKFLVNAGVEPERLIAKGYGLTRPVVTTCSKIRSRRRRRKCEAKNRRVEFVILEQGASAQPAENTGKSKNSGKESPNVPSGK